MFIFNIILKQLPSNKQTKTSSFIGNKLFPQKVKKKKQNKTKYIHWKMLSKKVDFDHLLQFHS